MGGWVGRKTYRDDFVVAFPGGPVQGGVARRVGGGDQGTSLEEELDDFEMALYGEERVGGWVGG